MPGGRARRNSIAAVSHDAMGFVQPGSSPIFRPGQALQARIAMTSTLLPISHEALKGGLDGGVTAKLVGEIRDLRPDPFSGDLPRVIARAIERRPHQTGAALVSGLRFSGCGLGDGTTCLQTNTSCENDSRKVCQRVPIHRIILSTVVAAASKGPKVSTGFRLSSCCPRACSPLRRSRPRSCFARKRSAGFR